MRTAWFRIGMPCAVFMLLLSVACGGSGSGSGSGSYNPSPQVLTITTNYLLPGTLTGHPYSVALTAINGTPPLKWSIGKTSDTGLFPNGLSIDANTGVVSGTVNWGGTAGFTATVTDTGGRSTSKSFTVTATNALQTPATQTATALQYSDSFVTNIPVSYTGGVQPVTLSVTSGSLPPGLRLNSTGAISGSANAVGSYTATITISDSYSPPEVATTQFTITVNPPPLHIGFSLPETFLVDRPFSGAAMARGGVPPYHFSLFSGSPPPGVSSVDPSSGRISGTPTSTGSWVMTVLVTDSSAYPSQVTASYGFQVVNPKGRNDSPAKATAIGNGMFAASLSPYLDPPNGAPTAADNDYYSLTSLGGSIVHLETFAKRWNQLNPIDTVLEIVDANGFRFSSCRQSGDASNNFNSPCMNDDIDKGVVQDSLLDFKVPGETNKPTTFFVRVLDWRGDARPDMTYTLRVDGIQSPLSIYANLPPAARGLPYIQGFYSMKAVNANGAATWAVVDGSLPPGLTLASSGAITGTATTNGIYTFTLQVTDSASPPQVATAAATVQVVEPVAITSSPVFTDACINQPYSFAVQTSGGVPPLSWSFMSNWWVGINLNQSTGVFSGMASVAGTYTGRLGVGDATGHYTSQDVTLTVKNCP